MVDLNLMKYENWDVECLQEDEELLEKIGGKDSNVNGVNSNVVPIGYS